MLKIIAKRFTNCFIKGKSGQSYNVGSNINIRNIDLVKKLIELCKKQKIRLGANSKISFIKDRPGHDFRYALNSNKIKREVNWRNKTNINNGLIQTIKWYKNNKKFLKKTSSKIFTKRLGVNIVFKKKV